MSKPNKPKVIKVDEHIRKSTKQSVPEKIPGKRGRPRKDAGILQVPAGNSATGNASPIISNDGKPSIPQQPLPQVAVISQYDTTEEAKGIISAPFSAVASLAGVPQLALTEFELMAIMPSWKVVYDKRIAPYLGQNADLYAFSFTMVNVCFAKFRIYQAAKPKAPPTYHVEPHTANPPNVAEQQARSEGVARAPAGATFSPSSFPGIPVELVK